MITVTNSLLGFMPKCDRCGDALGHYKTGEEIRRAIDLHKCAMPRVFSNLDGETVNERIDVLFNGTRLVLTEAQALTLARRIMISIEERESAREAIQRRDLRDTPLTPEEEAEAESLAEQSRMAQECRP